MENIFKKIWGFIWDYVEFDQEGVVKPVNGIRPEIQIVFDCIKRGEWHFDKRNEYFWYETDDESTFRISYSHVAFRASRIDEFIIEQLTDDERIIMLALIRKESIDMACKNINEILVKINENFKKE